MVEDNPSDALLFKTMIERASNNYISIDTVDTYSETLNKLKGNHYTAVLLDLHLPDIDNFENIIKTIEKITPELPVVILTGSEDHSLPLKLIRLGVQDYLCKNEVTPSILMRSLRYAKERKEIQLELKKALKNQANQNELLKSIVRKDSLTSLPNRIYFFDFCKRALNLAKRQNTVMAVLYFDINGFKCINDTYGHTAGDQVLKELGIKVTKALRKEDMLFRLSGDEFAIIAEHLHAEVQAYPIAKRINEAVSTLPIKIGQFNIDVTISIGIAVYPDSQTVQELVKHADIAMYEAKHNSDHFACFYSKRLDNLNNRNIKIASLLPSGLRRKEFSVVYQPIINCLTGDCSGVEALIRWNNSELGYIPPEEFINIAENSVYGSTLCCYVIREASKLIKQLNGKYLPFISVSINVAARQFTNPTFFNNLINTIKEVNLPPEMLCIEITERQVIQNLKVCETALNKIKQYGIQIALDDYGTGFSSITHLKNLPFDKIKIDRSLINNLHKDAKNFALTDAIISMARHLDLTVVAEGVEHQEELEILVKIGCDEVQGFHLSKPISAHNLKESFADIKSDKSQNKVQINGF
ncbi:GGDEF domain-containing response regulator [Endozoicomonas sp. SM1973]|uniref:GGDEF domain-containing response regulator n=1 Tax=Spartinivicinus marinus TaxID=2994442 RepID=A0A853HWI5_9GAMM|nr:GGDEF domain-containing response regulator [Spartinivicinus marinus]MCX4028278.1 GGDEF domain-containing response regulator [Spartinivicinus marinus]NYZ65613.1 GGDEF domain-containing response regulator [Spartinivicinus marinus]